MFFLAEEFFRKNTPEFYKNAFLTSIPFDVIISKNNDRSQTVDTAFTMRIIILQGVLL